jgi:hypothetical protein
MKIVQLNFSSRLSSGVLVSDKRQVLTCYKDRGCFGWSWHGGLLEPVVNTTERSTAEFVIEDTGLSGGCLISFGVTALDTPDEGWVQLLSWLFYRHSLIL